MALNFSFMYSNCFIIVGMTIGITLTMTIVFGGALCVTGDLPILTSIQSGLIMSSVGEISLLYINKVTISLVLFNYI